MKLSVLHCIAGVYFSSDEIMYQEYRFMLSAKTFGIGQ